MAEQQYRLKNQFSQSNPLKLKQSYQNYVKCGRELVNTLNMKILKMHIELYLEKGMICTCWD